MPMPTIGTIYASAWGYDQINIDFYEVTRATEHYIWLLPIHRRIITHADTHESVVPIPGAYASHTPIRRKPYPDLGNAVAITTYSSARPWNGQPQIATHTH